jgi:hypothetical protein
LFWVLTWRWPFIIGSEKRLSFEGGAFECI